MTLRTEARCLGITGEVSARQDVLTVPTPPTSSLREALTFIHQNRCLPRAPNFLRVTEAAQASGTIGLGWNDNSDNEDGFRVRFVGRRDGSDDHKGTETVGRSAGAMQTVTLSGLQQGFEYTFTVAAFNNAGESAPSASIVRVIPSEPDDDGASGEATRQVDLQRQPIVMGFIPYLGTFPPGGVVPTGRLLKMRFPSVGATDRVLAFPRRGKSTASCGTPNDVVFLREGAEIAGDDLTAIFGSAEPSFSILAPLSFVACLSTPGVAPPFVTITIDVRFG